MMWMRMRVSSVQMISEQYECNVYLYLIEDMGSDDAL